MAENNIFFDQQWSKIAEGKKAKDFSMFVPKGKAPQTQKQFFNLCYYRLIDRLIANKNYKNSIEFGCGRGTASLFLNLYNGIDTSLLDISEDAIKVAKSNFNLHGGQGQFIVADSAKTPVADNSFDFAVSMGLLEHLPNYSETMREMHRVLRPGGMLISMNIPKKKSVQVLDDIYKGILQMIGKYKTNNAEEFVRINDKPEQFMKNAQSAGFKGCRIIHANSFPRFSPLPPKAERLLSLFYEGIFYLRSLYKKEPLESGSRLSQCHFLIGYK